MYKFSGVVKKHLGRGKQLGFPTANIDVPLNAEEGIFFGHTRIVPEERLRPSVIFIGVPEMFGENDKRLETYILDFSEELEGKTVEVKILKKMRQNQKFESPKALIEQMKEDERQAREYFAKL